MNRRSLARLIPAVLAVPLFPQLLNAQAIPAFSGADGAGALATGGRGGVVYHVTSLDGEINGNRATPGTLGYGLSDSNFAGQPRTIVFDVGGTIWLGRKNETEGWDTQDPISAGTLLNNSKLTIAGQTAPGGITLAGGGLKMNGNNIVLRNVSIAPGYGARHLNSTTGYADQYVYDAINISGQNQVIDHVSTYFATDETISADERMNGVTVQYSNVSQGQNYPQADAENPGVYTGHALGSLFQPGTNATLSVLHNLYAHQKGRLPRVGTETVKLTNINIGAFNDFRNNVFYNWFGTGGSGASGQPSQNNFVNNYWLAGPGGDDVSGTSIAPGTAGGTGIFSGGDSTRTKVYHSGNIKDTNKNGVAQFTGPGTATLTNSDFGSSSFFASPLWYLGQPTYSGVTESPAAAYDDVLNYMGANWWNRSAIDARMVNEARTGTGQIMAFNDPNHGTEWNAILALRSATNGGSGATGAYARSPGYDTDQDGMPDVWEVAHGLDPATADNNGDYDADGYTNLEEYLNEVAEWPAPGPITFSGATNTRYAQITNWDVNPDPTTTSNWQPSRFDEAVIHSGSVAIEAVGQHARLFNIAPTAGDNGVVTLSAGWIDIAQQLQVANSGQFVWSGGQLFVPAVQLSGSARLTLTGGRDKILDLTSLSIANSAKLDLGDNQMIVRGGSLPTVTGLIASGRNGGAWNGVGIITSQSDATSGNLTSIGVVRAGDAGISQFAGRTVSANDVLVMYTYAGDANLDGKINVDDYGRIDFNVTLPGASGWYNGDFNYDGKVNVDDYGIIDFNVGIQGAPFPTSAGWPTSVGLSSLNSVPEPTLSVLAALLPLALPRRKRKS